MRKLQFEEDSLIKKKTLPTKFVKTNIITCDLLAQNKSICLSCFEVSNKSNSFAFLIEISIFSINIFNPKLKQIKIMGCLKLKTKLTLFRTGSEYQCKGGGEEGFKYIKRLSNRFVSFKRKTKTNNRFVL